MEKQITTEFLQAVSGLMKSAHQLRPNQKMHMGEFKMLGMIHKIMEERAENKVDEIGIKVSELSQMQHATRPATTKMLNTLEEKGYIERITDKKDRRVVYVRLSDGGNTMIKDALETMHALAEKLIDKMGKEDSLELVRLLNKLNVIFSEELKSIKCTKE